MDRLARAMHVIHESGHAVAALTLGHDLRAISDDPPEISVAFKRGCWRDELTTLMAGDAAVAKAGAKDRAWTDDEDARRLLEQIGRSPMELIFARERAETLIESQWPAVERLAAALLGRTFVTASDARRLVKLGGDTDEGSLLLLKLAIAARAM